MTTMKQENSADDFQPKFIKVYLPDESGDDLELPISFSSCLPKPSPRNVTVRSIYGNIWKMALRKCAGDVEKYVLVNGCKRILMDEDLKGGDLLAFEFDGSRCFDFCIYEHGTMCKRLRRSSGQSDEIKAESDGEEETRASDDVLGLDDDDDDDDDEDDDDDVDYNSADDNNGDDNANDAVVEDDDDAGDEYADDNDVDDAAVKDDDDVDDASVEDVETDDDDDDDDDERQYLDDRDNPSFTLTLNPKKKSQLLVPGRVIKDYDLNFPESITLVDPLVQKFGTLEKKIKIQTNGSVFVKGFGSIIRRNKVKTTDKMICEIKKTGINNLVQTIKIHVING